LMISSLIRILPYGRLLLCRSGSVCACREMQ
jgi:hypothetical protein